VDEPLFGAFLNATGAEHPARDESLVARAVDWREAVESLFEPLPEGIRVFYQKQHVHHLAPVVDRSWISRLHNVFLIRDPWRVVASYVKIRPNFTIEDIAVREQLALFQELSDSGAKPVVIDADDLLLDPESYLKRLCETVGVSFDTRMLAWEPGPRETDGPWGEHWYKSLWDSTGFYALRPRAEVFEKHARAIAEEALPYYETLYTHRLIHR
jgi:hypothetical protein